MNVYPAPTGELPGPASSPAEVSRFVVEAAVHAPSVHNTQPWWFSTADREISLHADIDRRLNVADPRGREMMISCGAALFTARVAMRSRLGAEGEPCGPGPAESGGEDRIWRDTAAPAEYERGLSRRLHSAGPTGADSTLSRCQPA
jgi:nitroreductase